MFTEPAPLAPAGGVVHFEHRDHASSLGPLDQLGDLRAGNARPLPAGGEHVANGVRARGRDVGKVLLDRGCAAPREPGVRIATPRMTNGVPLSSTSCPLEMKNPPKLTAGNNPRVQRMEARFIARRVLLMTSP